MITLYQFFERNKDILPVTYRTFKKRLLTQEDIKKLSDKKVILVLGGKERQVIKILDEDAFFNYFFGGKRWKI